MKCGECLMRDVKFVELVGGVCPECGADYRDYYQKVEVEVEADDAEPL